MNKHFLKNLRDSMPEPLKYISAPLIRNTLVRNDDFLRYYKLLSDRESLNEEQIRKYQFDNLKKLLIHSYKNVPYYTGLFDSVSFDPCNFNDFRDMEKIPFLTRELVAANFDKLVSRKSVGNGYYLGNTGGTSGLPLKFYLDYDSIYKENAFLYYYRKKAGYEFKHRLATFRQVGMGHRHWRFDPMYNEIIFSPVTLSAKTVQKYVSRINAFNPQFINGYLSVIWFFAKLLKEYDLKLNAKLKGIFLMSENVNEKQQKFVEEVFETRTYVHYGHSERCVLAEGIENQRYRFDPYYGYTEQVHICDDLYSIVGTGFLNYYMPFIRYKTDDVCTPDGQYFQILGKRSSNVGLIGKSGQFLTITSLDLEKEAFKNVITYQFVQKEQGKADMLIIVNKAFQPSEMDAIQKTIEKDCRGIIEFNITQVDHLILTPRGKSRTFVSYLNPNINFKKSEEQD